MGRQQKNFREPIQWCAHDECIKPPAPDSVFCRHHTKTKREDVLRDAGVFGAPSSATIQCEACDTPRLASEEVCSNCEQAKAELASHINADTSIFDL